MKVKKLHIGLCLIPIVLAVLFFLSALVDLEACSICIRNGWSFLSCYDVQQVIFAFIILVFPVAIVVSAVIYAVLWLLARRKGRNEEY